MATSIRSNSRARRRRGWLIALGFALLAGSALGWWAWRSVEPRDDPDPPDPRLSYAGPFLNVAPEVRFVGDAKCADCHPAISKTYARHPMGRTLAASTALTPEQGLTAERNHPVRVGGFRLRVLADEGKMTHRVERLDAEGGPAIIQDHSVDFRVGSGTRGYSYLAEIDGRVFQTPISWFSGKNIWDISPGFDPSSPLRRPIETACLFCHSNRVRPDGAVADRFRPGVFDGLSIGCERCHGPGERHVAARERGESVRPADPFDKTIVNPRRLSWQLRENVCEQCHLKGEARVSPRGRDPFDFRPGMPLEQFLAVYVDADGAAEKRTAVNHVEQMYRSRCFQKSPADRKLGCISCHDPHEKVEPARRDGAFRERCMKCHTEASCKEPLSARLRTSPRDSCIDCHMPRYSASEIAHTALTDHRIVRRAGAPKPEGERLPRDLILFHNDRIDPTEPARQRDRAIALMMLRSLVRGDAGDLSQRAVEMLDEYADGNPGDAAAWQFLGRALFYQSRIEEAGAAFQTERRLRPQSEFAWQGLALVAQRQAAWKVAAESWREAAEVNPLRLFYQQQLARALRQLDDPSGELEQVQGWLRLDPFSLGARRRELALLERLGAAREVEDRLRLFRRLRIRPDPEPK